MPLSSRNQYYCYYIHSVDVCNDRVEEELAVVCGRERAPQTRGISSMLTLTHSPPHTHTSRSPRIIADWQYCMSYSRNYRQHANSVRVNVWIRATSFSNGVLLSVQLFEWSRLTNWHDNIIIVRNCMALHELTPSTQLHVCNVNF